jgi:hypothetical protein
MSERKLVIGRQLILLVWQQDFRQGHDHAGHCLTLSQAMMAVDSLCQAIINNWNEEELRVKQTWYRMAIERLHFMFRDRHALNEFLHTVRALVRFPIPCQGRRSTVKLG